VFNPIFRSINKGLAHCKVGLATLQNYNLLRAKDLSLGVAKKSQVNTYAIQKIILVRENQMRIRLLKNRLKY
jgi:hypothetical protein